MSFWEYANPRKFMAVSDKALPWLFVSAAATLAIGLIWGFFFTPDDFRQGSTVKIIYLHVPSAMMAINAWAMMLVASLIWIVRRHHVSALAARAAAPVGVTFTVIALAPDRAGGQRNHREGHAH
ncbi:MAG: cytochrome c biogenesis protein, partial [Pseudomonadota bacterium]